MNGYGGRQSQISEWSDWEGEMLELKVEKCEKLKNKTENGCSDQEVKTQTGWSGQKKKINKKQGWKFTDAGYIRKK